MGLFFSDVTFGKSSTRKINDNKQKVSYTQADRKHIDLLAVSSGLLWPSMTGRKYIGGRWRGAASASSMGVFALWLMSSVAKVPETPRGCRVRALFL